MKYEINNIFEPRNTSEALIKLPSSDLFTREPLAPVKSN